jgi:peptide/nickel transport system substrate-binding protein
VKNIFLIPGIFICVSFHAPKDETEVCIHHLGDPDMLNPVNYQSANAGYVMSHIFPALLGVDFKSLQLVPVVAESRPLIEKTSDGKGLKITYSIRKEAVWDNGSPVTAKDVEFTLKVIKCPLVENPQNKPYYKFIEDIWLDPDNPRKFTLLTNSVYILAEISSGDYGILPEYLYDPAGFLRNFSIRALNLEKTDLKNDPRIVAFASDFNSEKRMREPEFVNGCGAYKLKQWVTGQKLILEKKKNWWGDALEAMNCYFEAYPSKLIFVTIYDQNAAIVSMKTGNIDVMYGIKPGDFSELQKDESFRDKFHLFTPPSLQYTYIGINTKLPKFSDKRTRQALAHLLDVDQLIKDAAYGFAKRIAAFIHPADTLNYNSSLVPRTQNIALSKKLLAEAGWADTDKDGILDKIIDGEKILLTIRFTVNAGNDVRKQVAINFQEQARKAGIAVDVIAQEWSVYLENQKTHNFELFYGAWISSVTPNDPKQIYHTESANGGANYTSFGTPESDEIIENIRQELDEKKRAELYKKLQTILHEEVSYIYLWAPTERIAISRQFENTYTSLMRPGFWPASFK